MPNALTIKKLEYRAYIIFYFKKLLKSRFIPSWRPTPHLQGEGKKDTLSRAKVFLKKLFWTMGPSKAQCSRSQNSGFLPLAMPQNDLGALNNTEAQPPGDSKDGDYCPGHR